MAKTEYGKPSKAVLTTLLVTGLLLLAGVIIGGILLWNDLAKKNDDTSEDIDTNVTPTTTIAVLRPVVSYHNNRNSNGGVKPTGATADHPTLEKCILRCQLDDTCEAIDYGTISRECWLHKSTSSCSELHEHDSITHVKLRACPQEGTTRPATTPPTTRPHFVTPPPVLSTHENRYIASGDKQVWTSLEACTTGCQISHTCVALDFNSSNRECFYHTTTTACATLRFRNGITHVKLLTCGR